jgi:hypothetical protein
MIKPLFTTNMVAIPSTTVFLILFSEPASAVDDKTDLTAGCAGPDRQTSTQ